MHAIPWRPISRIAGAVLAVGAIAATAQAQPLYTQSVPGGPMTAIGTPAGTVPMLAVPITMAPAGTIPPPVTPMIVMVPTVFPSPIANVRPMSLNYYQVKTGGRLGDVARRVKLPLAELRRLNPGLSPGQWLPPGTLVNLPVS